MQASNILLLVACVSLVLGAFALKLWFLAQRCYRRWRSPNRSLYASPGSPKPRTLALEQLLYGSSLGCRAKVFEVLQSEYFQEDLDEEPVAWQERVDEVNQRMAVVCGAGLISVEQLTTAPADFFEAIEVISTVSMHIYLLRGRFVDDRSQARCYRFRLWHWLFLRFCAGLAWGHHCRIEFACHMFTVCVALWECKAGFHASDYVGVLTEIGSLFSSHEAFRLSCHCFESC